MTDTTSDPLTDELREAIVELLDELSGNPDAYKDTVAALVAAGHIADSATARELLDRVLLEQSRPPVMTLGDDLVFDLIRNAGEARERVKYQLMESGYWEHVPDGELDKVVASVAGAMVRDLLDDVDTFVGRRWVDLRPADDEATTR